MTLLFLYLAEVKSQGKTFLISTLLVEGFPGGSAVKIHLLMQEMLVQPLGQKDPLEKEMETHSRILAWRIPGQGRRVGHN